MSVMANCSFDTFDTNGHSTERVMLNLTNLDCTDPSVSYTNKSKKALPGGLDVEDLAEEMLGRSKLFEDPEFPAQSSSLAYSRKAPRHIKWARPKVCAIILLCTKMVVIRHGSRIFGNRKGRHAIVN